MTLRVAHITIYGRDLRRMIGFYHEVLGLPLLASDEAFGYARVDGGSVRIGLGPASRTPRRASMSASTPASASRSRTSTPRTRP